MVNLNVPKYQKKDVKMYQNKSQKRAVKVSQRKNVIKNKSKFQTKSAPKFQRKIANKYPSRCRSRYQKNTVIRFRRNIARMSQSMERSSSSQEGLSKKFVDMFTEGVLVVVVMDMEEVQEVVDTMGEPNKNYIAWLLLRS